MNITDLVITPIAFPDPPLLNAAGVHESLALRTVVRLEADGLVGWGEGRGGAIPHDAVGALRDALLGMDPANTQALERAVDQTLRRVAPGLSREQRLMAHAGIEVASLDLVGKAWGVGVSTLLGGAVRERVDYSAYLFFKWAGHLDSDADEWGEAVDAEGIVRQARTFVNEWGFRSIKLKAGALPPAVEIDALRALAQEFPGLPLRIDPNGAWSEETAVRVASELDGLLEYYEDPVLGIDGMSRIRARTGQLLATNMCVTEIEHVKEAARKDAIQVLLSDHHNWGGLRRTRQLGAVCEALGIGVSMHSNSHLGISLAAMTHVAAAIPNLSYACDTHYPWNAAHDVVSGGMSITGGAVDLPGGPGLGVEVDEHKVAELHENFVRSGRSTRRDGDYMRRFQPEFSDELPRY